MIPAAPWPATLPFETFERCCLVSADALEDRLLRYVSSPQEHDLAGPTLFPFLLLALGVWDRAIIRSEVLNAQR